MYTKSRWGYTNWNKPCDTSTHIDHGSFHQCMEWHILLTFFVMVAEPTPNSICFAVAGGASFPCLRPRGVGGGRSHSLSACPISVLCNTIPIPRISECFYEEPTDAYNAKKWPKNKHKPGLHRPAGIFLFIMCNSLVPDTCPDMSHALWKVHFPHFSKTLNICANHLDTCSGGVWNHCIHFWPNISQI